MDDEIGVLIDIGALDVKERAGQQGTELVVLTEDENSQMLEVIIGSSGLNISRTVVLPYHGVTGTRQLRPLVKIVRSTNGKAKIVVHRDRDFLKDEEVEEWKAQVKALGVEPFVTAKVDIESYFISPAYLSEANPTVSVDDFKGLITDVVERAIDELTAAYVNGRVDLERKAGTFGKLDLGKLATEASKVVSSDPFRYSGKIILRAVRAKFRRRYGHNLLTHLVSSHLRDDALVGIARKMPKSV